MRNKQVIAKSRKTVAAITVATALIYIGIIVGWHLYTPRENLDIQAPGADNRPEGMARSINDVLIGEFFMRYDDISSDLDGKWICFRGEQLTNIIVTPDKINTSGDDYPVLWSVETGEGYAAPVIYNGKFYFLDYIEALNSDALRSFSLETGKELWRRWYRSPMKRNHGFSRTVPAIGEGYIITIGPQGHVMCCDPVSGNLKWAIDMQKEYKTEIPMWYTGQCPYVDGDILILAPAGDEVLMTGIDVHSGEPVWTTPNTPKYRMSHSSVTPMTLLGKRTYVYVGEGGVCGVSADEADRGALLWDNPQWRPSQASPSPVQISAGQFFAAAGYGTGGAMLRVDRQGDKWTATVTKQYKAREGLSSEQQTPILYNGMFISVMPNDGSGRLRLRLVCFLPADLHNPVWISDERFGFGSPYIVINKRLFLLNDDGKLYVFEIMQNGMKLIKQQRILNGADAWGPLAYADGTLIVRDDHTVVGLKISE